MTVELKFIRLEWLQKSGNDLRLEPNPRKKRNVTLAGGLKMSCGLIEISIVVRGREFCVKALVGAVMAQTLTY